MAYRPGKAVVIVLILLASVALMFHMVAGCLEGLTHRKAHERTRTERPGLPEAPKSQIPPEKEVRRMFPGVPFGNAAAAQSVMGSAQGGAAAAPEAPSPALSQLLGLLQPLGEAPDLSGGDGARINASGLGGSGEMIGGDGAMVSASGAAGASTRGASGSGGRWGSGRSGRRGRATADARSALPKGIPKSKIPRGQENMYILKSEIVPPVCPACPACPECPRPICPKPDPSQCPPCPAPGRCPPPAFGCQRVPLYQNMQSGVLPTMMG